MIFKLLKWRDLGNGYRYASENIRKNKEFSMEFLKEQPYDIKYVDKNLRRDKDIIETYWNGAKNENFEYVSVIGIDCFGNKMIDEFLRIEKERHTLERINQYEEQTENVQFVKTDEIKDYQKSDTFITIFDKEIFSEDFKSFIILIGEKENSVSKQIKEKYQKNGYVIEIYTEDIETSNIKLITKNKDKIIDLLRVIIYDEFLSFFYYNLGSIRECLQRFLVDNRIEIQKYKGSVQEVVQKLYEIRKNTFPELYIVQLVVHSQMDEHTIYAIYKKMNEMKKNKIMGYFSSHQCNIEGIEVIIMKIRL